MRYEGNKVVITESELRWLVNETANNLLNENEVGEGAWGGWKNAWRGAFGRGADGRRNYNFNLGQTYRAGRDASSFAKYAQQATKAIEGMRTIAANNGSQNVSNSLNTVQSNLQNVSTQYERQAQNVANGSSRQLRQVDNPWSKTQKFDDMKAERDRLQQQYSDLQTQNNQLQGDYDDVQDRYRTLQGDYNTKQKDYDALQGEYNSYKKQNPVQQTNPKQQNLNAPARKWTPSERQALINMGVNPDEYDAQKYPQKQSLGQRFKNGLRKGWQRFSNTANNLVNPEESTISREVMPESRIITVSEDYIRNIVNETLKVLKEDGEAGGGGATNAAGVMHGGGTNPGAGTYDVPAFGGKTNKKKVGGNAFSEPIMRQAHNLGDVTSAKVNQVDMKPALKRGGSIAMGESRRRR